MRVFWDRPDATAAEARDALSALGPDLAYVTVANLVRGLHDKGILTQLNTERPFRYRSVRSFEDVSSSLLSDLLDRVFGGSRELLLPADRRSGTRKALEFLPVARGLSRIEQITFWRQGTLTMQGWQQALLLCGGQVALFSSTAVIALWVFARRESLVTTITSTSVLSVLLLTLAAIVELPAWNFRPPATLLPGELDTATSAATITGTERVGAPRSTSTSFEILDSRGASTIDRDRNAALACVRLAPSRSEFGRLGQASGYAGHGRFPAVPGVGLAVMPDRSPESKSCA